MKVDAVSNSVAVVEFCTLLQTLAAVVDIAIAVVAAAFVAADADAFVATAFADTTVAPTLAAVVASYWPLASAVATALVASTASTAATAPDVAAHVSA